jgi:hypothetical protein
VLPSVLQHAGANKGVTARFSRVFKKFAAYSLLGVKHVLPERPQAEFSNRRFETLYIPYAYIQSQALS